MDNRLLARKASFKKAISHEDGRRRRNETTLQIRKEKREGALAKRRAASTKDLALVNVGVTTINHPIVTSTDKKVPDVADLPRLVDTIRNPPNDEALVDAIRGIRRMLAVDRNAPTLAVKQSGVLPYLVQILKRGELTVGQFEASWVLTNVASSQYTADVVKAGSIEALIQCLCSVEPQVREQAAWCLGNIAGDCPEFRDLVLEQGVVEPICRNLKDPANPSLLGNVVWTVSNLLRGKPAPEITVVTPFLEWLVYWLHNAPNNDVLTDICWSLSYLSDGPNARIQMVMQHNVTATLVQLLEKDSSNLLTPVIRCLGNFVSGNDEQTQAVIDANFLQHVKKLLTSPRKNIRKETCWVLSNIAAGTPAQIQTLFKREACLSIVVDYARKATWEIRKESLWVVANIFTGGYDYLVNTLATIDGIQAICEALTFQDPSMVLVALEAVDKILEVGERTGKSYFDIIDECEGVENMEQLQNHANEKIYEKVISIIDKWYGRDEDEDENLAPAVDGDTFAFGMPNKQLFSDKSPSSSQGQQPFQQYNF